MYRISINVETKLYNVLIKSSRSLCHNQINHNPKSTSADFLHRSTVKASQIKSLTFDFKTDDILYFKVSR